jgi:hypothetical protein
MFAARDMKITLGLLMFIKYLSDFPFNTTSVERTAELHVCVNTDSYIFTALNSDKRIHLFQLSINVVELFNVKQTYKEVSNKMYRYVSIS